MKNSILNYIYQISHKDRKKWRPLLGVFYLTYACDFRCYYCCDGKGVPYHKLPNKHLSYDDTIQLLKNIRKYCDYLVITGGEPLKHPDFDKIMENIGSIGFDGIILTTNGYDVDSHVEAINKGVQHLVFSMDFMNPQKTEEFYGREPEVFEKILNNIELANNFKDKKYEIIISSVVTPNNIDDLYEVFDFAKKRNFRFAPCPQLMGVKPHSDLHNNEKYSEFFNHLIKEKKKGADVQGGIKYLSYMRDLEKFSCVPSTVLAISPQGEVFYPCLEIGNIGGNLLSERDLDKIRQDARNKFGDEPSCDNRCHSACALGLSLVVNNPGLLIPDSYYLIKSAIKNKKRIL